MQSPAKCVLEKLRLPPGRQFECMKKTLESHDCQWLMLDSGSCLHACPRDFSPSVPMRQMIMPDNVVAVNGERIPVYGV
eukprot:14704972-Heterocapsa_arctica.AAC.1